MERTQRFNALQHKGTSCRMMGEGKRCFFISEETFFLTFEVNILPKGMCITSLSYCDTEKHDYMEISHLQIRTYLSICICGKVY